MTNSEVHPNNAKVQELYETAKKCIGIYGVAGAIVLATLIVVAVLHGPVSTFMWVRAGLLLAVAPMLHRLAVRASQGSRPSLDRLRTVTTVLPIAIVVIDLIPGVCPGWYAALQGVSALALIAVAVITRRRALDGASPTSS
ncbi:hypothetical protein OHA18_09025 [Kribbella sp. NBC_00709]|uniref:hypothetical protein n=1 Tax=Kribbella sp. NBC_00709 TaxID=2975972 RepID=UPI002E2E17FE|nr:hypothetical protein [Kribbella sp. NBC_00709]